LILAKLGEVLFGGTEFLYTNNAASAR